MNSFLQAEVHRNLMDEPGRVIPRKCAEWCTLEGEGRGNGMTCPGMRMNGRKGEKGGERPRIESLLLRATGRAPLSHENQTLKRKESEKYTQKKKGGKDIFWV